MERSGKVWGWTSPIFDKNNVEIHYIDVKKGGFCSKHYHVKKFNMFLILSGEMLIKIWKDYGLVDETTLTMFQGCIVPPGGFHQFEALKHTRALEIYWTEIDPNDIVRESVGGFENGGSK